MPRTSVTEESYDNDLCKQFVNDMLDSGLTPYHYQGRWYWEGPAVNVDSIQDAVANTNVPCQWDNMGLGYVVYPKQAGKLVSEE